MLLALGFASMPAARSDVSAGSLASGQVLAAGQQVVAPNGLYRLAMQDDGDLVLSFAGRRLWSSGTAGHAGSSLVMRTDGNLVVRSAPGQTLWSSGTENNLGAHLVVQDDGNVVIYTSGGQARWSTNTAAPAPARVMVVGDSVALTLGGGIERWGAAHGIFVLDAGALGCTLLYDATVRGYWGVTYRPPDPCRTTSNWEKVLPQFRPDVIVALFGAWDVYDASWDAGATWSAPGDPVWNEHYLTTVRTAASQLASTGAAVLWLDPPCYGASPGATDPHAPWFDPARVTALANVIGDVAVRNRMMVSSVAHDMGCPVDYSARPDGVHYDDAGADAVTQRLVPEIDTAARGDPTYVANYTDAQYAMLESAGRFFHVSTDDVPGIGVAALSYIIAGAHHAPAPMIPPPENTGTHAVTVTRDASSAGPVRTVTEHYMINGDQAHYVGGMFMIYLWLALGRH